MMVMGWWLELMILDIFSNLHDSVIVFVSLNVLD